MFVTYHSQPLVTSPQLSSMRGARLLSLEDRAPPLDPSLGCRLAEVDLLALVTARVCVKEDSEAWLAHEQVGDRKKNSLQKLGLGLLLGTTNGHLRHTRVGTAVEDVLSVYRTLT